MFKSLNLPVPHSSTLVYLQNSLIRKAVGQIAAFSLTPRYLEVEIPNMVRGIDYLKDPRLNKGLAFTLEERQQLGIQGLLAGNVKTLEEQVEICKYSLDRYKDPLNKYLYLSELQETNEKLFYNLISTDIEKFLPLCYTPTVGLACQKFGLVYKKPRGLFITINDKGRIGTIFKNWPETRVKAICVTDGERILGLGDLGAYGMGIPVGKLILTTGLAGVKPHYTLPIVLDVGTNRQSLLEDPLYIGVRQKRCKGKAFDEFIDEFMYESRERYGPNLCVMFEDFAMNNATRLLEKYRKDYCTFNDDIQGTAAVAVAGLLAAVRITKRPMKDNIYMFYGAGSAGTGIANLICDAMVVEGLSLEEARKKVYLMDIDGLLSTKRKNPIPPHAKHFGKDMEPEMSLEKLVEKLKPTVLIGTSTVGASFTPTILKQMAKNVDRPVIFALSNPTIKAECTAQQAYDHTEGRCIYASGSPFPPVKYNGKEYLTGQGNNAYVYPGIALGIIAGKITRVPDIFFLVAAQSLASLVKDSDLQIGRLYPSLREIREISDKIANNLIEKAYEINLAGLLPKPKNILEYIKNTAYDLDYPCYIPEYYKYPSTSIRVKTVQELSKTLAPNKRGSKC